jgi:DNA invertase Pin-like site-specific DNA recombinase
VTLAKELQALGIDLVVLDQAIDTTTPSGRFTCWPRSLSSSAI